MDDQIEQSVLSLCFDRIEKEKNPFKNVKISEKMHFYFVPY